MASSRKKASIAKTPATTPTSRAAGTRALTARTTSPRVTADARGASHSTSARGRPARRVFINVSVRESTRKAMNTLRLRHGITQGELLDQLFTGKLRVQ